MCNDLLHVLENYPEIIALHKSDGAQPTTRGRIPDCTPILKAEKFGNVLTVTSRKPFGICLCGLRY